MENLIDVENLEQFNEIKTDKLVVVDFWAEWCGPCKNMLPVIDELSVKNKDVTFLKVNVDKLPEIAGNYNIRSIPNFIFLKNGNEFDKKIGFNTESEMQETIDEMKE